MISYNTPSNLPVAHAGLCYVRHITLIIKFGGEILGNIVSPGARPKTFNKKAYFLQNLLQSLNIFFYSNLMSRWWQRDWSPMASDEVVTNRDPGVFTEKSCHKSRLQPWPIRGKNLGHMICSDQSEVSIRVM